MKLRALVWVVAVVWAVCMTVAMARIMGSLDSLASRPDVRSAQVPAAAPRPSQVEISLHAPASAPNDEAPNEKAAKDAAPAAPPTPEQAAASDRANDVLAQIVAHGALDDGSATELREALMAMQPESRIKVLAAFATAATRGEIQATPEDYRRILP
jgi:outer membrane biosynthesis protein TonB